jgi:membrane-associated phospholipid phosphatase
MIAVLLAVWTQAGPSDKVGLQPAADVAIVSVAAVGALLPELFRDQIVPARCRLCDGADNSGLPGTGTPGSLNGVDAFFHDRITGWLVPRGAADVASSVVGFVLVPAGAMVAAFTTTGPFATSGAGARAAAIVLESAAVAGALTQGVKVLLARKRPFVRYGDGEPAGAYDVSDRDSHEGFPSGHTAFAASLGVSAAMTASLEDSSAAPWLWGAAAAGSITTGMLRMIAEKHYFTDVVGGAAIGAACGVVFPLLHRRGSALSVAAQQGPAFAVSGAF